MADIPNWKLAICIGVIFIVGIGAAMALVLGSAWLFAAPAVAEELEPRNEWRPVVKKRFTGWSANTVRELYESNPRPGVYCYFIKNQGAPALSCVRGIE